MKVRDSGMPDQEMWQSFFNPVSILQTLGLDKQSKILVDFGCGYGTFSLAAAELTNGKVIALDIDPSMLAVAEKNAAKQQQDDIQFIQRDFISDGTGLANSSIDFAMIFNLLHTENPQRLLDEAHRILTSRGKLAILHWNYDANTPRGPDMSFRPKPSHILSWVRESGFLANASEIVDFPPYHYGLTAHPQK